MRLFYSLGLLLLASCASSTPPPACAAPDSSLNLRLEAPIRSWDEAIPLGNGLMGGLLWGEGKTLRISLDRGDLWDERTHGEKEWWKTKNYAWGVEQVRQGKFGAINAAWDGPYNGATPTKLPGGRLEIDLAAGQTLKSFELDLAEAEGLAKLVSGESVSSFFSATEPVALLRIPGLAPSAMDLIPAGSKRQGRGDAGPSSGGAVASLGYPAAVHGQDGEAKWFVQQGADGFSYCVCLQSRRVGEETQVALAVTSSSDGAEPLALARQRCARALDRGYSQVKAEHKIWWQEFWAQSSVTLPPGEEAIARQYQLVQYFHGAASRRGAPPMPLQGVWTADNGGLPPWKGDYHNDLNTQMSYIAYPAAGHYNEGLSYLDFLWQRRAGFTAFAKEFYGTEGLACPGVMSLSGQPLGGWGQYSLSPTMTAWSAHLFYLHWRHSHDREFLATRAYPWCADAGRCMLGLLKPDAQGLLKLPLSSSPEIFDNSPRAWLKPNSTYDLMCLRMLFLSLQNMAGELGKIDEAKQWKDAAAALGDDPVDAHGVLQVAESTPLSTSHRHLSNLIGIYPFNLVHIEGSDEDRRRIKASLASWDKLGTRAWVGYSFSWMSCLRARVGDSEKALNQLDIFCRAFVLKNGFHVNGDQTKSGYSGFTYRPFTLEGNFLAAQAVHEMLLQSWSPDAAKVDGEIIRLFPSTPWRWHDCSFSELRAEGGHRVSAKRENNATTSFKIVAGKDGVIRLRDNFGGRPVTWNRSGVRKVGDNYEIELKMGEVLEGTLAKPEARPAAPADVAPALKH